MTTTWHWYVYIIECADGLYYTGMTWNLEQRIEQHRCGKGSKFTTRHGCKYVRWVAEFRNIHEARACEKRVKDFRREKKEALWSDHPQPILDLSS